MKKHYPHHIALLAILLVTLLILDCQKKSETIETTRDEFLPDSAYFEFGAIFNVEKPQDFSQRNPHHVAQYSVYLCKEGLTDKLIEEIGHVEKDRELGKAFIAFIREYGPDMERFKSDHLRVKFAAYSDDEYTSTWYYYLVDGDGTLLTNEPWISLHRSKYNGKCALTGIFLNFLNEEVIEIPKGLKTSK